MVLVWLAGGSVLIILIAAGIYLARRPRDTGMLRPKGHWMSVGISFGLLFGMIAGLSIGVALGDVALGIALGPAMGLAFGSAIGAALEEKFKDKVRTLTEAEIRRQRWALRGGIAALIIGVAFFLLIVSGAL
ncbi:MAG: hypothetical protein RQ758_03865 [Methanomicrobiaceae archaeon]|nr:hypothetical protein [Methanomicrobiaceae archaeon]